jgi:putative membrane protein
MNMLLSWLILSVSVWLTAAILPGFQVTGFWGAIKVAAIFGLLNFFLGWLLFVLLGIATLGIGFLLAFLLRWLVNAILLKVTDALSTSLHIKSFGTAFVGGLLMSGIGTLGEFALRRLG